MLLYLPGWADLGAVLTTWGVGAVLLLSGAALGGGRQGGRQGGPLAPEFRLGAGWGAFCLLLTAWGVFLPLSLRIPAVAAMLAAVLIQLAPGRRLGREDWRALGRLVAVSLPLWAVMAGVRPSQIDTFLNLLPNADYLVDYGRLPTASLPPAHSWYPAAPYNTQFLAFLGSLAYRDYPAAGMSLINVMLRLVAGLAIARVLAGQRARAPSWAMIALGMLVATLLDPGFVPRFHFSAYGENALAVTALLAACLWVEAELPSGGGAVALALILAAMINTKQSGIGLVLALAGAAVAVRAAERRWRLRPVVAGTGLVLLPAALLYAIWRYHAARAGVAELEALPPGAWNWAVIPATLRGIAAAVAEKPVYFFCVAAAFPCLPLLLRRRDRLQGWSQASRFAGFFAAAFVLYNGFLLVTYVAHFSPEMSAEAHSYFRYNTHLSLVLVLALALAARELAPAPWPASWRTPRLRRAAGAAALVLALAAPVALAERLRFDIEMPQPLVWDLAAELKPYLKDGDRLAVLAPGDDGEIGRLLGDYLASAPPRRRGLDLLPRTAADPATLDAAAAAGYGLAVITCTPAGLDGLPAGEAALLRHAAAGWQAVASWPHAAGIALSHWQRARHWPALCR